MSEFLLFTHSKSFLYTIQRYVLFYPFIRSGKKKSYMAVFLSYAVQIDTYRVQVYNVGERRLRFKSHIDV